MEILVFKTNLSRRQLKQMSAVFDATRDLIRWHVDFADCDRVLRIEGQDISSQQIMAVLREMGVACEELT